MPTHPAIADIGALTRLMLERRIEFILVGGAAAIAHGSPTSTRDYDVVHARNEPNELLPHSVVLDADGRDLRVLDLPTLIEVKTAAGRPKDKIIVAELLAILDRKLKP